MEEAFFEKHLHHTRDTSHPMQIFHDIKAAGLEIRKERHAVTDALEIIRSQTDVHGAGHCNQVEHRVSRTAGGSDEHHRIFKCFPRHDVSRLDVVFQKIADGCSGADTFVRLQRILGGSRRAVR